VVSIVEIDDLSHKHEKLMGLSKKSVRSFICVFAAKRWRNDTWSR
jgi:hypothetical protein